MCYSSLLKSALIRSSLPLSACPIVRCSAYFYTVLFFALQLCSFLFCFIPLCSAFYFYLSFPYSSPLAALSPAIDFLGSILELLKRLQFRALVRQPYLTYRPDMLHRSAESIPWNRFLGSLNVYKFGLCTQSHYKYCMEKCLCSGLGPPLLSQLERPYYCSSGKHLCAIMYIMD